MRLRPSFKRGSAASTFFWEGGLKTFQSFLETAEKWLLVSFLSTMILLSFLQVILRQFFSTGILWADVFLRHLVLWAGFMGAAIATAQDKHFVIDAVKRLFPEKAKKWIGVATDLFSSACLFFLCGAAIRFFKDDMTSRSVLFTVGRFEVPTFWMNLIIPAGVILLLVHFLIRILNALAEPST